MLIWVLILVLIPVFGFILIFNRFVRLKNMVKQAWSDIDVQLKRRHDLIPKLVEAVKGYAVHEKDTLRQVVEARNACMGISDGKARANAETALGAGLRQLFALAENYPDLKANRNFLALQQQISELEDNIQMARRFYNGAVKLYNVQLESFPSLIVAKMFRYQPADYFELEAGEEKSPELSFREDTK
ncbi:MAG: LemA family protein [Acidobacteria bacterium]|nr:LemA family protein [Acidobacteriota bacterium]